MRRTTRAEVLAQFQRCCDLIGVPTAYDAQGNYLPTGRDADGNMTLGERPSNAHAIDFGGGPVRGACVYRYADDDNTSLSAHYRAHDVFFFAGLDQRRPLREVAMILRAIEAALGAAADSPQLRINLAYQGDDRKANR